MLARLSVSNFALIVNAQLNLKDGFTVITGETGSGKSILLGALQLILGERADYSVIRDKEQKTVVEAEFQINGERFQNFYKENDLDNWGNELLIRREINANGKSRAFINDSPVSLQVLKDLTQNLIYIHSQHHTLELRDKSFQLSVLDTLAENDALIERCATIYSERNKLKNEIENLKENRSKIEQEADFNRFQLEELSKLKLEKEDYDVLQNEVERGEQFEEVKNAFVLIYDILSAENGAIDLLNSTNKNIYIKDDLISQLLDRINSVVIELKDISDIAQNEGEAMELNPEELLLKTKLLDNFHSALRKHNLTNQAELLHLFKELQEKTIDAEDLESVIAEKEIKLEEVEKTGNKIAKELSERRKKISKTVEKSIKELLNELKFEDASVLFDFQEMKFSSRGIDDVTLFFSPNKGIEPQVIEKSASGGELSRLMLAIQYLLSQKKKLPTIIFDEIDTGVSGEVAQKIGIHLKKLGERMQLLAITHLPQVASKGSHHILVEKSDKDETTKTSLKILSEEDRVYEIAKLMSGSSINEAALLNAKNLMNEQ